MTNMLHSYYECVVAPICQGLAGSCSRNKLWLTQSKYTCAVLLICEIEVLIAGNKSKCHFFFLFPWVCKDGDTTCWTKHVAPFLGRGVSFCMVTDACYMEKKKKWDIVLRESSQFGSYTRRQTTFVTPVCVCACVTTRLHRWSVNDVQMWLRWTKMWLQRNSATATL